MNKIPTFSYFAILFLLLTVPVNGQSVKKPAPTAQPAPTTSAAKVQVRQLAPNVFYKVNPFRDEIQVFDRHDVTELLAVDSNFEFAKDVSFHRDIWYLEFEFKPMRMVEVNIPQKDGNMLKQTVWYLVYKVRNPGKAYHVVKNEEESTDTANIKSEVSPYRPMVPHQTDEAYKIIPSDQPIDFIPYFTLESTANIKDPATKQYKEETKTYRERFIPLAVDTIRRREDPARKFLTSIELCRTINVGEEYWGVATWTGVDKRTTKFRISVTGLTNAYRWNDNMEKVSASDPKQQSTEIWNNRVFERKVLILNFWRPADEYYENEKDIIFGIHGEQKLDYFWIYRPLGT